MDKEKILRVLFEQLESGAIHAREAINVLEFYL